MTVYITSDKKAFETLDNSLNEKGITHTKNAQKSLKITLQQWTEKIDLVLEILNNYLNKVHEDPNDSRTA